MRSGTWVRYIGPAWRHVCHTGKTGVVSYSESDYLMIKLTNGEMLAVYGKDLERLKGEERAIAMAMAAFRLG